MTTQVVELQGVAVESVPEGAQITTGEPTTTTRSVSDLKDRVSKADSQKTGQATNTGCGCATLIFLIIFLVNGGRSARCDRPLPEWLLINVIVGFSLCGAGCFVSCFIHFVASRPAEDPNEPRKPTALGKLCLCMLSLTSLVTFALYVQGNVYLWSTFPNATVTDEPIVDGTITDGLGCDPDLYWALRGYMVFTFVMMGICIPCVCCAVCITAAAAGRAA